MNGVKLFFRLLAIIIILAMYSSGSAQVFIGTIEVDQPILLADTDFKFDMPDELQSELPQDKARAKPKPPRDSWLNLGFLGPIFQILFYGILAVAVLYILYLILSAIVLARRSYAPKDDEEELPETPTYRPDEETARVLLNDADKLAAQGKFAEAVHAILFRSIQDIEDKRPHHVKRSLTSREIASLSVLSPVARAGFSTIGSLVERSFFGGRPLGAGDYEISKSAYKDFAFEKITRRKTKR